MDEIRLTQYSHGAGCGCKIAPKVLDEILHSNESAVGENLLVGNDTRDDAAVYDLGDGRALISTTDFFMPIVDDPFDFGRVAAANSISDIYAMGGTPVVAIAVLGWPLTKLPARVAQKVIAGARLICKEAGISIAGGHSIDSPEPIFGLAVNGIVEKQYLKRNFGAEDGDLLFLTKPLGIGVLTTAEKKGILAEKDKGSALSCMTRLNNIGAKLGRIDTVHAMTDVTGFGLGGHLSELCIGSRKCAELYTDKIQLLPRTLDYIQQKAVPGGTGRNFESYGQLYPEMAEEQKSVIFDPQTSGGLLVAVAGDNIREFQSLLKHEGLEKHLEAIGKIHPQENGKSSVSL